MLGCYDFCGHYEWTFGWLEREYGTELVQKYWRDAIGEDSQKHARELIVSGGFAGMEKYWGHTLAEESPNQGYTLTRTTESFRIDMHDCPSKGFLLRNGLENYHDYCDHCIGWIGPMMKDAGFVIDHEHNHCGQCWWLMRRANSPTPAPPTATDVRQRAEWIHPDGRIDRFEGATGPQDKA